MSTKLIAILLCLATPVLGDVDTARIVKWLADAERITFAEAQSLVQFRLVDGSVAVSEWLAERPFPSQEELEAVENVGAVFAEHVVLEESGWRALTSEEVAQARKTPGQRAYENAFFDLIDELLVLVDDPQDPTPKLGFPELQALIAQVQSVDPMAAVNLSLNLLTIDAALKRYDTMWWDNAVRHDLGE